MIFMNNPTEMNGRCGIITGAASGIGQATAIYLAQMGARVALVDIDNAGLQTTHSHIETETSSQPVAFVSDMTDASAVNKVVDDAVAAFGSIDFLVNCAGILRKTAFLDISLEEWDLMYDVNVRGVFICCQAVARQMVGQGSGTIVNVASLAGRSSSLLGGAHYTSAKHAIVGLSRHMARELTPRGIRVNAFCPGATLTPMVTNSTTSEEIEAVAKVIPRGKWAAPEEQAAVIGFLISDAAANITGACIDSNGGSLMV
jgi:3-oxoacyl-[acyl-carrier protein] reductase